VDENQLTPLRGNTPPAANAQNDAGRVSSRMPLTDLILVLQRSPEVQAAFDAFVASQYDPSSPNFHQWLTPEQVGEKFGPATADIATVSAWLSSHGLSVDGVSKDRMTIRFSGTAGQVEATFHTELHNLTVGGQTHYSNMSDPQIPMALEPVVLGPKALHNFIPRPLHRVMGHAALNKSDAGKTSAIANPNAANVGLRPDIGFSCGTNCQIEDVAPFDFAAIYNITPLWSNGIDGTGQTIAIAGRSDVRASDVSSFRSTFGLSGGTFNLVKNGTDPGFCTAPSYTSTIFCTLDDQIENGLDVEWAGATAPKATVDLVVTQQTMTNDAIFESASYAIDNVVTLGAKILNVSYGNCELFMGTSNNAAYNQLWQSAATAGISVFVASGDSGSPACDQGESSSSGTPYGAQFGLEVSGIASSQYDTAVGGTDLNWGATASPYWNSTNDTSTGASAKGYMPETPWNNSCTNPLALSYFQSWAKALVNAGYSPTNPTDAETACNFVVNWYQTIAAGTNPSVDLSGWVDSVGAGGGASNCTTNSSTDTTIGTCSPSGYSKPSWQTGVTGIPSDGKRDIPDLSFFAGNGLLGSAYFICVTDWGPCLTSRTATSEPTNTQGNVVNLIGGTSAASPAMAGIMALVNQKAGSAQGNPNRQLYLFAAAQNYANCKTETVTNSSSCYFNDIDTGTIAMPCQAGSSNCSVSHSGDTWGVLSGFGATAGYDAATGLGSMNVANVVNGWPASTTGNATATVAVSASPATITSIAGTTVTVTVSGSSGTPTGSVFLTSGSYTSPTQNLDSSGSVAINVAPGKLPVGTDTVTAHFSGDPTYAANTGTTSVTVTLVNFTLSASAPAAITAGGSATSNITVASTNGYTGTVTLTCALTSSPSGAVEAPACAPTAGQSAVTLTGVTTSASGQVTVSTTVAPTGAVKLASNRTGWFKAAGGVAFASLVLFFLPGWSKRNRNIFCTMLVVLAASFFTVGCGGGGGSSGGGGGGTTKTTPTVTVTPASATIKETDTVAVTIKVAGSGTSTPSGSVTMSSGTYNSGATALSGGTATITIPAGKLAVGATDTLTVSYGGDTNFNSASGTATVTVTKAATTSGSYTFTVTGTGNDAASTTATTTFSVTVN